MQTAYNLEPTLLSPELLIECVPYARPDSFLERMKAAAQRGWLQEKDGSFGLTDAGREVVEGMYELGGRLLAKIKTLPYPEMVYLLSLFDRVINAIKELPEPAKKPTFALSSRFDRGVNAPLIVQVRQRILILLAFRHDAHMAAWQIHESDGRLWEAFTLIWREQAGSAAELAAQLPHRNYTTSDYADALAALNVRGWIMPSAGRFIAQEQAAKMRQDVETATDRSFAAAFTGLTSAEMREFQQLMLKFAVTVKIGLENKYQATIQPVAEGEMCLDRRTAQIHTC
jgi:hypothetical protein